MRPSPLLFGLTLARLQAHCMRLADQSRRGRRQSPGAGRKGGRKSTTAKKEVLTPSEVKAVDPVGQSPLDDSITCLARTIYWEAKGETART